MKEEDRFLKQLSKLIIMIRGTNDSKLIHEFYDFMEILQKDYHRITEQEKSITELGKRIDSSSLRITKNHGMLFDDQIEMRHEMKRYMSSLDDKLSVVKKAMFLKPRKTGIFLFIYGKKFLDIAKEYEKKQKGDKV